MRSVASHSKLIQQEARTAMAGPGGRGGPGAVWTTKGLCSILALLCLVGLASSGKKKASQEDFNRSLDVLQEAMERTNAASSDVTKNYVKFLDLLVKIHKMASTTSSPPLQELIEDVKNVRSHFRDYVEKQEETLAAIRSKEEEVDELMEDLEEAHDEL